MGANGRPTYAELQAKISALEAEQKATAEREKAKEVFKLKVSPKGAVSVYGLGRFPITLYKSQMERLLGHSGDITKFIADNAPTLKVKEAVA